MAFSSNWQRQGFMDALQQLVEDPEQLSLQRAQRYDDPPPPYPSSSETTQPVSPVEASVSDEAALQARRSAMLRSVPREQFDSQTSREKERIIYQREEKRYGRRQTLPYDGTADLLANIENNVRARWVKQGIWKEEWGPAWPKGARPWDPRWRSSHENTGGPYICTIRWGHEKKPEPKPAIKLAPEAKLVHNIFIGWARDGSNTVTEELGHGPTTDVAEAPTATCERDTSASRPYHQFFFQVSQEREWISDELRFRRSAGTGDIDAMAYQSVKKNWIEDEVWNPIWGDFPGMTWMHEDLEEEDERRTSNPHPDGVSNNDQIPHLPSSGSSKSRPTPNVYNDSLDSNDLSTISNEAEDPSAVIAKAGGKRERTQGALQLTTINESSPSVEELADRVLRGVRSSNVRKSNELRGSTFQHTRSPKQGPRMLRPSKASKPILQNKSPHTLTREDANLACMNEQSSTKRLTRTSSRQLNGYTKDVTSQLLSAGALNNTRRRRTDQPIASKKPRRSNRIATQQKIPVERKHKTAASSNSESKGRSLSIKRAASTAADINRIRKRQHNSDGWTRAKR